MVLGALVDVGLSVESLVQGLRELEVGGWSLTAEKTHRGAFHTTRVKVNVQPSSSRTEHPPHSHHPAQDHGPGDWHTHEHGHGHSHEHSPTHSHEHAEAHAPSRTHSPPHDHSHSHDGPTRGLKEILSILHKSKLPKAVVSNAERVFRTIANAEAKVHGVPVEHVHFHEVGAVDSIIDIVGACLGIHLLGIDEVYTAPLTVGTGFIHVAHGMVPLPAPATIELLRGFPVVQRESGYELTTPTGAALLTTLAQNHGVFPPMVVQLVGYGAGDDRPGAIPNALRVIIGDRKGSSSERDRVVVLETNIDDMSSQWLGNLYDQLLAAGALDVAVAPITMKKSRPAHELKVIAPLTAEDAVIGILFRESTTFGIRRSEKDRLILEREIRTVDTAWGPIRIKIGKYGGSEVTVSPEYEDLRAAASKSGLPLKEVYASLAAELRLKRPAQL